MCGWWDVEHVSATYKAQYVADIIFYPAQATFKGFFVAGPDW